MSANNQNRASASKLSNGPILISSQPMMQHQQSINGSQSSYATSLGAKANNAIKTLMVNSHNSATQVHHEPHSKHRQRAVVVGQHHKTSHGHQETISSQHQQSPRKNTTQTNDSTIQKHHHNVNKKKVAILSGSCDPEVMRGADFRILIDDNQHHPMSLRSPTDSKFEINSNQQPTTHQKHRGYSILNMPVNVMADESDDEGNNNNSNHHKQQPTNETEVAGVTATTGAFGLGGSSTNNKYPDLFFQGYGIELLEQTVEKRREKRRVKRRRLHQVMGANNVQLDESCVATPKIVVVSSSQMLLHLGEQKESDQQTCSDAKQTLVLGNNDKQDVVSLELNSRTISSEEKSKNRDADHQHNTSIYEERLLVPIYEQKTIEAKISQLSILKEVIEPQAQQSNENAQVQKILATSQNQQQNSNYPQQCPSSNYSSVMKRNSEFIVNRHVKLHHKKQSSIQGAAGSANLQQASISSAQYTHKGSILKQLYNKLSNSPVNHHHQNPAHQQRTPVKQSQLVSPAKPVVGNATSVKKSKHLPHGTQHLVSAQKAAVNYQAYITKQPSPPRNHQFLNRQSNSSMKRTNMHNVAASGGYQPNASESPNRNDWRNGQKKAPPLQPGLKRFKTQTKESQKLVNQLIPAAVVGGHQNDVGLETSSFNEDLSKIDAVENISGGGGGGAPVKPPVMMPRISQKNFTNNEQQPSDDAQDADVKELSVVESDNSDPDGVDTPAVYMKKRMVGQQNHNQHQNNNNNNIVIASNHTPIPEVECTADPQLLIGLPPQPAHPTKDEQDYEATITPKQKVMHIQVLDAEDESIVSHNKQVTAPTPSKQHKISYLSSNDSAILAQSYLTHGSDTAAIKPQAAMQKQQNILVTVQNVVSKKASNKQQNSVNMHQLMKPLLTQQSTPEKLKPHTQNSDSTFLRKRLSSTNHQPNQNQNEQQAQFQPHSQCTSPYKRSNTKDERRKYQKHQLNMNMLIHNNSGTAEKKQQVINRNRMAKNMPLRSNRKVRPSVVNNGGGGNTMACKLQYSQQFVDSDFYDNHSFHRGVSQQPQNPNTANVATRMRSTSPVSSQASTFIKQRSIRTNQRAKKASVINSNQQHNGATGDNTSVGKKSSLLEDSEMNGSQIKQRNQKNFYLNSGEKPKHSESAVRRSKRNIEGLARELQRKEKRTDQMIQQNRERQVTSRMYQQKFIERRERQEWIISRHVTDHSDHESQALAYAMQAAKRSKTIQRQTGLETLRKVHDSIGLPQTGALLHRAPAKHRSSVKNSMDCRNNPKNRTNLTEIQKSVNSSTAEECNIKVNQSYEQHRLRAENQHHHEQSFNSYQQMQQPMDQGIGDQQADIMAERGGQKLTSDESSLKKPSYDYLAAASSFGEQTHSSPPNSKRNTALRQHKPSPSSSQKLQQNSIASRQFRVPKMRAPVNYQNVVERKYNMLQTDAKTYFLPGAASHSVYKTNASTSHQNAAAVSIGVDPLRHRRLISQPMNADFDHDQSMMSNHHHNHHHQPLRELNVIEQRKKSHELNSVRNQQLSDMERIKKLTDFSVTQQLEKNKNRQTVGSGGGRDDPSNVIGFQNIGSHTRPKHPRNRTAVGQLDYQTLKDKQRVVLTAGSDTIQKGIYGMLSDLNRAKTMRIANQVLKEQQQQFYAVKHHHSRREQLNSQGAPAGHPGQKQDFSSQQKIAAFYGQSPKKRTSLEIETTMPSLPPAAAISSNNNVNNTTAGGGGGALLPSQTTSGIFTPIIADYSTTGGGPQKQNQESGSHRSPPKKNNVPAAMNIRQQSSACATKPETPLANNGLRIIQTNLRT